MRVALWRLLGINAPGSGPVEVVRILFRYQAYATGKSTLVVCLAFDEIDATLQACPPRPQS